ncbi:putative serine/threonine-protein kinase iks1 [Dispira parvispora]|uniref:non-specific serine/threonine protein kinase n=1 Tax=Dispira parvispora TaxID=1520584 RepID=A0A9W8ANW4_9FUNG|nr:putative serine/threonine-protein kinase iks1 [Dispira parvispora]
MTPQPQRRVSRDDDNGNSTHQQPSGNPLGRVQFHGASHATISHVPAKRSAVSSTEDFVPSDKLARTSPPPPLSLLDYSVQHRRARSDHSVLSRSLPEIFPTTVPSSTHQSGAGGNASFAPIVPSWHTSSLAALSPQNAHPESALYGTHGGPPSRRLPQNYTPTSLIPSHALDTWRWTSNSDRTSFPTLPTTEGGQVIRYSPPWTVILRRPQQRQMVLYNPIRNQVAVYSDDSARSSYDRHSADNYGCAVVPRSRSLQPPECYPQVCWVCHRPFPDVKSDNPDFAASSDNSRPSFPGSRLSSSSPHQLAPYRSPSLPSSSTSPSTSSPAPVYSTDASHPGNAYSYIDRNYFRVLAALPPAPVTRALTTGPITEHPSRLSSMPSTALHELPSAFDEIISQHGTPRESPRTTRPPSPSPGSAYTTSTSFQSTAAPSTTHLSPNIFNQGYYHRFFVEEQKLGKGLRGSVYLCQHVLDNIPLGLYAIKKVAVGDDKAWLERMLREVKLMETLHHPNIIDYKHSWIELEQLTRFGPKVPCLFILMDCANGGNLEQYVEARWSPAFPESTMEPMKPHPLPSRAGQPTGVESATSPSHEETAVPPMDDAAEEEAHQRQSIEQRKQRIREARRQRRLHSWDVGTKASSTANPKADPFSSTPPEGLDTAPTSPTADSHNLPGDNTDTHPIRRLTLLEIHSMFQDICEGLRHLHHHQIIHRDIKPSNMLLHYPNPYDRSGIPRVILTDFGECEDMSHLQMRNRTGATGTMEFMAPELLEVDQRGRYLDVYSTKADMWSLGMILYYLCYSRLPYTQIEDVDILRREILGLHRLKFPDDPHDERDDDTQLHSGMTDVESEPIVEAQPLAIPRELKQLMKVLITAKAQNRPSVNAVLESKYWKQFTRRIRRLERTGPANSGIRSAKDSPSSRPASRGASPFNSSRADSSSMRSKHHLPPSSPRVESNRGNGVPPFVNLGKGGSSTAGHHPPSSPPASASTTFPTRSPGTRKRTSSLGTTSSSQGLDGTSTSLSEHPHSISLEPPTRHLLTDGTIPTREPDWYHPVMELLYRICFPLEGQFSHRTVTLWKFALFIVKLGHLQIQCYPYASPPLVFYPALVVAVLDLYSPHIFVSIFLVLIHAIWLQMWVRFHGICV